MEPLPRGYIRLLHVEPGQESLISCKLTCVPLASAPPYKALSYMWGSPEKPYKILNAGKLVPVTTNLHSALRRLRCQDRELVIWIDAICIDQENTKERSEQVRMMTDIYYGAEEVLVWLCEETELAKVAFRLLWKYRDLFAEYGYFETNVNPEIDKKTNLPSIYAEEWVGLVELFRTPYWERVWIIQEIVKARQAKVICGSLSVDWQTIANVSRSLQSAGMVGQLGIEDSVRGCASVAALSAMKSSLTIEMLPFLEATRHHKATDPRDKYFALLGVVTDSFGVGVPVDYSRSLDAVYTAVAIHSLTSQNTLRCLSNSGAGLTPGASTLPSWVPDWRHDNTGRSIIGFHGCFNTTGTSTPNFHVSSDSKSLTVRGFIFDSVSRISKLARAGRQSLPIERFEEFWDPVAYPPRMASTPEGIEFLKDVNRERLIFQNADLIAKTSFVPPNQTAEDMLWRTLVCDMTPERTRAPLKFRDTYRIYRAFLECFDESGEINEAGWVEMKETLLFAPNVDPTLTTRTKISSSIHSGFKSGLGRRICRTEKTYLAHAAWEVEEGDKIVLFLGADVPFLIRPDKNDPGSYQLVGECYVHGIMDGEAIEMCIREGKIPEDIKLNNRPLIVGEEARNSWTMDLDFSDPEPEDGSLGSINGIKDLYQGPEDSKGRAPWVDKYPDDVEEAAETEETAKYAFIARKKKCFTGRKKFDIDSIIVNSPAVKKVLGKVFHKYPGVTCSLDRLVFNEPFKPFVHRWSEFKLAVQTEQKQSTKIHLELLYNLLREELKDTIKAVEDFILNGVTTFEILWAIFQPKCAVYSRTGGLPNCQSFWGGKYKEDEYGRYFRATLEPIGWNGTAFKRGTEGVSIYEFSGTKPFKDLNACPLHLHPQKGSIRSTLVKRGKKYEEFAGYHYKAYDGTALDWDSQGNHIPVTVTGRIIIDTESFNRNNPARRETYGDALLATDFEVSQKGGMDFKKMAALMNDYQVEDGPTLTLTDDGRLICKSTVPGYSLKQKKWLLFFVDFVQEIEWDDNAFNSLVLPEDTKDLLMAFVDSQVQHKSAFDDVIQGKGKGIIMLLSGPPGVGKTLTAESVAESMHIPLYIMSAGDLGTRPDEVETSLQKILDMVAKWDAILLLDECDVFLEARTNSDLERNKLVSIFLRTLEYYEGILFLTTNRVSNMDAAFQSRIHVSMEYPNLTVHSRRQIWKNFLKSSKQESLISDEDLDDLALVDLNGRQIKNVIKMSFLLSMRKKMPLKREFIDIVLAIEGRRPVVHSRF